MDLGAFVWIGTEPLPASCAILHRHPQQRNELLHQGLELRQFLSRLEGFHQRDPLADLHGRQGEARGYLTREGHDDQQ